jgi:hypothetical protein
MPTVRHSLGASATKFVGALIAHQQAMQTVEYILKRIFWGGEVSASAASSTGIRQKESRVSMKNQESRARQKQPERGWI